MKNPKNILITLVALLILAAIGKIVVVSSSTTNGTQLSKLQSDIDSLDTQNTILKEKLLGLTSLHTIASEAATMGFVEPKNTYYITSSTHLAAKE